MTGFHNSWHPIRCLVSWKIECIQINLIPGPGIKTGKLITAVTGTKELSQLGKAKPGRRLFLVLVVISVTLIGILSYSLFNTFTITAQAILFLGLVLLGLLLWIVIWQYNRRINQNYQEMRRVGEDLEAEVAQRQQARITLRESEFRNRALLEAIPDTIVVLDSEGTVLYYKGEMDTPTPTLSPHIGRNLTEVMPPEVSSQMMAGAQQALVSGKVTNLEFQLPSAKQEQPRTFHTRISVISGGQQLLLLTRDISDRIRAEEAVRSSEEKLRNIVEHSSNLFYSHTPDHKLTYMSSQTWDFLDCGPDEAMVHWTDFVTDNPINRIGYEQCVRSIETGQRQPPYELELIGRKNRIIWVEVHEAPVVVDGKTVAIVGALTDITDNKRAEDDLRESEQKHRVLIEQIPAITYIASIDSASSTLYLSPQLEEVLGFKPETFIQGQGSLYVSQLHDDDRSRVLAELQIAHETGQPFSSVYRMHARNGRELWIQDHARIVTDTDGNPLYLQGVMLDITEKKRAEETLHATQRTLQSVFRTAPVGISVLDNSIMLEINQQICNITGYRREEIIGQDTSLLYPTPEEYQQAEQLRNGQAVQTGFSNLETRWQRKDGSIIDIQLCSTPLDREQPQVFVATALDITQRKQVEAELSAHREHLEELVTERTIQLKTVNRELESFAYSVSHDLRAPLRAISGFAQIISRRHRADLDVEGRHYFDNIIAAGDRMEQLISDLLYYSQLGKNAIHLLPIPLTEVMVQVQKDLQQRIAESGTELGLPTDLPVIAADRRLLVQLFSNLFENAMIYHTPGLPPRVEVSWRQQEDSILLMVSDNGIGIAPALQEKAFNLFQRLHADGEYEGTGVGLALVKKAAELLEGSIRLESEVGRGCTFYIELPYSNK